MKNCTHCRNAPATLNCGICNCALCKNCEEYVDPNSFSYREKVSTDLTQGHYCHACFESHLKPEIEKYQQTLEKAHAVYIFFESKPTPRTLLKKANKGISVNKCLDKDQTFLRLGFLAAEKGYNAVTNASVERTLPRKLWKGKGIPALIDAKKQERFEF